MYKILAAAAVVVAFGGLSASAAFAQNMTLTSAEVADGSTIKDAQVANVFGCKGGNISPSLSWSGAPSDTKSFAITVYDPDAPTGSGFWHWVVFNIPASTTSIPVGAGDVKKKLMPKGAVQSRITTSLRSMRSTRTSCNSPRTTMYPPRSSASNCISTARRKQA